MSSGSASRDDALSCCVPAAVVNDFDPSRDRSVGPGPRPVHRQESAKSTRGQVSIAGGVFLMGDPFREGYPADGETPVHEVRLRDFYMDATTVTNGEFGEFVNETGYVTEAERFGVSAVFHLAFTGDRADVLNEVEEAPWWFAVRGASWRSPEGPGSEISSRQDHPVVHVSWNDAQAFCAWAGKRLPTEAEWEFAARGGLAQARFAWGDELAPEGEWRCNIWQGQFPVANTLDDGYLTTAPVRSYRPNLFGIWQMAGNVWEWVADWYDSGYYGQSARDNPSGPAEGTTRVLRGGSYLCHASYCHRYRVAARSSSTLESTSGNVGFRCANNS